MNRCALALICFSVVACSGSNSAPSSSASTSTPTSTPTSTQTLQPYVVVDAATGKLGDGLLLFVNTSAGRTDWLTQTPEGFRGVYPSAQAWGFFGAVNGGATGTRPPRDLSAYKSIELQMRGDVGGEVVSIGIKDSTDPDDGTETKKVETLPSTWKTLSYPLADFRTADLTRLYLLFEVVFDGSTGRAVYLRDVRYVP